MSFALIAGLIALVAVLVLIRTLSRQPASDAAPLASAEYDLQVYRDQLAEVDRDLARGVLAAEDAERSRLELSRRILAADRARQEAQTPRAASRAVHYATIAGLCALVLGGGFWLYRDLGAPGYPDLARATRIKQAEIARETRPPQAEAEAAQPAAEQPKVAQDYLDLVRELRKTVAQRPQDAYGLALLARHEMALGNVQAAYQAQAKLIALKGAEASAEDHASHADMLVIAAGGYVSPKAEAALQKALERDAGNGVARYYYGRMLGQIGRPDLAFRLWARLLNESRAEDPWVPLLRGQIEEMAYRAGVEYTLPPLPEQSAPEAPGPSAEDVEAAQEMSAEERKEMIEGMVTRLAERLANEGGSAQDWARLIGALGVLGQRARAAEIWTEARGVFAGRAEDLALLKAAATQAGLSQ